MTATPKIGPQAVIGLARAHLIWVALDPDHNPRMCPICRKDS
jgi:hypothetical protein